MQMGASALTAGLLGSLVAGLFTGVGALPIFLRQKWSRASLVVMLAIAAGVMLGATVFSLLVPALELAEKRSGSETIAAFIVAASVLIGAVGTWALNAAMPHEHFVKGREGAQSVTLGRNWLFVLAIALHNFPEGMSVGVAYGAGQSAGLAVTIGMALQNMPEGLAVAAALMADGQPRAKAFWIALATGLVEPVGGLLGAGAVSVSDALLPWGLGVAAGAMLFVISGEIIPETHREGTEHRATLSLVAGFVVMMLLDVLLA